MGGRTMRCPGVCGGDPKWRSPELNMPCSLCGGSGEVTTYDQRELDAKAWDQAVAARKARGERAQAKREAGLGRVEEPEPIEEES